VPSDTELQGEWVETEQNPSVLSDATTDEDWTPGAQYSGVGHHWVLRKHFKGMQPETKKVFNRATSGEVPLGVRDSIEGKTRYHRWDDAHRKYDKAADNLINDFAQAQGVARNDLTPAHANQILNLVANSQVPHIKDYREFILRLARMFALRTGR
jgi:hypothetical protein